MKPDSITIDHATAAATPAHPEHDKAASGLDLTDPRVVAALTVPPCSTVLAIGLGDDTVPCALSARMCRVFGVEGDPEAARSASPWCEAVLPDLETIQLETALAGERCDVVLFVHGVERARDLVHTLRRAVSFLAPRGRVVLVAPSASPESPAALDCSSLNDQLRQAGLRVLDDVTLPEPIDRPKAAARRVLIAASAVESDVEIVGMLAGAAMERVDRLEHRSRHLEARVRELDNEVSTHRAANRNLRQALEEARDWHRRSAESVSETADTLRREVFERERLQQQLAATAQELEQCRVERRFLRDDLAVKDAYLASLREEHARHVEADRQREITIGERQLEEQRERQRCETAHEARRVELEHEHEAQRQQWDERLRTLTAALDATISERDAEASRVRQLEAANGELGQQIASAQEELRRVHVAVADTLAQPRYVLADRVNSWTRRIRIVHRPLKRFWLRRHRQ